MPIDSVTSQGSSAAAAAMSGLAAVFSAITAYRSYLLSRSLQEELKSDERLVVGKISHPDLHSHENAQIVIQIPLFNKSRRKAYIDGLTAYDKKNQPIEITWSDEIDKLGNPQHPSELVGVIDTATVYVRRNFGDDFEYARILFSHSFAETRQVVVFDPGTDFANAAVSKRQRDG